jgi:hypothetical protein
MNYKVIIILLSLTASLASAGNLGDAVRAVCNPMQSKPDFYQCALALRGHSYFETKPLQICASLTLNSDKSFCLKTIGDITYDEEETATCIEKKTDSEKIQCLIQLGHNYYPD